MTLAELSGSTTKFTRQWLCFRFFYFLFIGLIFWIASSNISWLSSTRLQEGLLSKTSGNFIKDITAYCFSIIMITNIAIMLMEISLRKGINILQYLLISGAQTLFYLLLLSFTEQIGLVPAYIVVTAMTMGLIGWFFRALTGSKKCVVIMLALLFIEYFVSGLLAYLGKLSMLVGSVTLFALIAVAMYLTLRLRLKDNEFYLK